MAIKTMILLQTFCLFVVPEYKIIFEVQYEFNLGPIEKIRFLQNNIIIVSSYITCFSSGILAIIIGATTSHSS